MRCVSGGRPGCVLISMSGVGLSVYFRLVCSSVCVFRLPCLFLIDSVILSHWLKLIDRSPGSFVNCVDTYRDISCVLLFCFFL